MIFPRHITAYLLLAVCLVSCNDEVFVKPLEITPLTETIDFTGGTAHFKSNQQISSIWMLIYRRVNGKAQPISDRGMQFAVYGDATEMRITNDLCDITLDINKGNELTVTSAYNLFADTIYMNFEIVGEYESAERGLRILPQPGFDHGKIKYQLNSWYYKERTDTMTLLQIGGAADNDVTLTLRKKGEIVARRAAQFQPWNKLLSDNIFGRDSFKVEGLQFNPPLWIPELSDEMITYTSAVRHLDTDPLLYDRDLTVTVPANRTAKVRLIINGEQYGVGYELPAISPLAGLKDMSIDGIYWLSVPVSYSIETEIGPIKP